MRFQDALAKNPAPKTLGDVRLRYDGDLLIGETRRPTASLRPTALATAGFASGFVSAVLLLLPGSQGGSTTLSVVFGVAAAALILLSAYGEQHGKAQRRFALNFFTETFRVDRPSRLRGAPETVLVKFDDVLSVGVTGSTNGGAALWVEFKRGRELIVDAIPEEQGDDLVRLHRVLEGAFGIRPRPNDADSESVDSDSAPEDSFDG